MSLKVMLARASAPVRELLERSLAGGELTWRDAATLSAARGNDLHALCVVADELRAQQVGDAVTYVVNRNINFTNVCVMRCQFCAFSRELRSEQAYFLDEQEVVRRAIQAHELGATEVCLQAGLAPEASGAYYLQLCKAIRHAVPSMHIHGCSPEEIKYGAKLSRSSIREYLTELVAAGLGSIPGTSAEILDDTLRQRIAPERLSTGEWVQIITTAHELGIKTSSTMMFGHVESAEQRARHLELLRSLQRATGGFTEFVPLSFVHADAPLFVQAAVPGVLPGPSDDDTVRLYAIARLMLGADIPNLQVSWVKEGLTVAQRLLACGANDLGGTLMNESISTSAGAQHGQLVTPSALRRVIRDAGRQPIQRSTLYEPLRTFTANPANDSLGPLDNVQDAAALFGSYQQLTGATQLRYRRER